ncbi:hypothetical protein FQN54_002691 [Arachnomyces sp. PD_36]|nr:hypothetical protein FQN54_002691 [Arachnomyces sp. PD_36]
MGHSGSKEAMPQSYPSNNNPYQSTQSTTASSPPGAHFPLSFNVYFEKSWSRLNLLFGQDQNQPLYGASLPEGWYGKLLMHNGPNVKDSATLATVKDGGKWGCHSEIILSEHMSGGLPIREEMHVHGGLMHMAYLFSTPIGGGRSEKFEWRRARRHELKPLGESSRGWKLVRLGEHYDKDKKDEVEREIVALWAEPKMFKMGNMSFTKAATFQFVNSGATGELGDVWALMAVVTFTRVWQRVMQLAIGASAAA